MPSRNAPEFPSYADWLSTVDPHVVEHILVNRYFGMSTSLPTSYRDLAKRLVTPMYTTPAITAGSALDLLVFQTVVKTHIENGWQPVYAPDVITAVRKTYPRTNNGTLTDGYLYGAIESLYAQGALYCSGDLNGVFDSPQLPPTCKVTPTMGIDVLSPVDSLAFFNIAPSRPRYAEPSRLWIRCVVDNEANALKVFRTPLNFTADETKYDDLNARAEGLTDKQWEILRKIHTSGGMGRSSHVAEGNPHNPVVDLINRGLLRTFGDGNVVMTNDVVSWITGHNSHTNTNVRWSIPALLTDKAGEDGAIADDAAAAMIGVETTTAVISLLEAIAAEPILVRTNLTLGKRGLKKLLKLTGLAQQEAEFLLLLALASNLVGVGEPDRVPNQDSYNSYLAVTTMGEKFLALERDEAWAKLVYGWARTCIDTMEASTEPENFPDWYSEAAWGLNVTNAPIWIQRALLAVAAQATPGCAVNPQSLSDWLSWRCVERYRTTDYECAEEFCTAAKRLGLLDGEAVCDMLRAAATGTLRTVTECARRVCPKPVSALVFQNDLTVIAPGLLSRDDERMLSLIAECERPGFASSWRVSEHKLRAAIINDSVELAELEAWISRISATPVPSTLSYVLEDCKKAQPVLSVVPATAIISGADPAMMDKLVADEGLARYHPRRHGDGAVAVDGITPHGLRTTLYELGYLSNKPTTTGDDQPAILRKTSNAPAPLGTRIKDWCMYGAPTNSAYNRYTIPQLASYLKKAAARPSA